MRKIVFLGVFLSFINSCFSVLASDQSIGQENDKIELVRQKEKALLNMQDTVLIGAVGNKGLITVFADPNCPHCREFYSHIDEIISQGYVIQMALLPITSHSVSDYSNIICSNNPEKNLDIAFKTQVFPPPTSNCNKDFSSQNQVSVLFQMLATPYFILPDGRTKQGFSTIDDFLTWLKGS